MLVLNSTSANGERQNTGVVFTYADVRILVGDVCICFNLKSLAFHKRRRILSDFFLTEKHYQVSIDSIFRGIVHPNFHFLVLFQTCMTSV